MRRTFGIYVTAGLYLHYGEREVSWREMNSINISIIKGRDATFPTFLGFPPLY